MSSNPENLPGPSGKPPAGAGFSSGGEPPTPRPKIHLLADQVANQIAAGEVVERPAAVVKELVENSLDAGASRIEVEIRNGGRSLIRVEDNGSGMSPEDARMSIRRHATSKIREAADLFLIRSFGFRGEALPSIASVSRFRLQTRDADANEGFEILVRNGQVVSESPAGIPVGTRIEVTQLFGSVPARRKFLKKDSTESAHVHQSLRLLALAHPTVAFRFVDSGREVFQMPQVAGLEDRMRQILGSSLTRDLIEVDATREGVRISGFVSRPPHSQATRNNLIFYVNARPVLDRLLSYATVEAFHGWIPRGRYPVAVLFIEVDPSLVDFNVHPAKREIRFREEARVRFELLNALLDRLEATRPPPPKPNSSDSDGPKPAPSAIVVTPPPPNASHPSPPSEIASSSSRPIPNPASAASSPSASVPHTSIEPPPSWEWLAPYGKLSAIYESPEGLAVLHLRAAAERVLYEKIETDRANGPTRTQDLLIPETLDLPPLQAEILLHERSALKTFGLRIEEFGRGYFRIESVPDWLDPGLAVEFTREWIGAIADGTRRNPSRSADPGQRLAHLASRLIAAGPPPRQAKPDSDSILGQLFQTRNPLICPRGRPTLVLYRHSRLLDEFGRDL